MKENIKRILKKGLITFGIMTFLFGNIAFADQDIEINLNIDDELFVFPEELGNPFADDNQRTQVPLRATLETLNANVEWNQEEQKAVISKEDNNVEVLIGKDYIIINGNEKEIDTVPVVRNERIYLPIRFVVEAFGGLVTWDQETKTVIIKSKEYLEELSSLENDEEEKIEEINNEESNESKENNDEAEKVNEENLPKSLENDLDDEEIDKTMETNTNENIENEINDNNDNNEVKDDIQKDDENETNAEIKGTNVNIRTAGNISSQVLTKLNTGDRVTIISKRGKWFKISFDDEVGFVYDDYLNIDDDVIYDIEEINADIPTVDDLPIDWYETLQEEVAGTRFAKWSKNGLYSKILGTDAVNEELYEVCTKNGIDPAFVKCLMIIESGGQLNTKSSPNSNGVYYVGLMQVASNYGFDNQLILTDASYAIECGIEVINRKISAAKSSGKLPTVYEIAWRYNSYSEAGRPYAQTISCFYEQLTGKSRDELVTLE